MGAHEIEGGKEEKVSITPEELVAIRRRVKAMRGTQAAFVAVALRDREKLLVLVDEQAARIAALESDLAAAEAALIESVKEED